METVTEPSQKGHRVNFRVEIDMTPYGVKTGQTVDVTAEDAAANKSAGSTVQTTKETHTPHYGMDFVPYIKSIYPAVSGSANRSRLGKFPVRAGEDMVIEGMNFAKGKSYTVNFYKSTTADGKTVVGDAVTAEQKTGTILTAGQITVKAPEYSRWVEVVVGGVATRNNTNENSGCNIEEGYVAGAKNEANEIDNGFSKANKAGTNFWTDDRYISVWNVGTTFADSYNPIMGTMEKLANSDSKYLNDEKYGKNANTALPDNTLYGYWAADDNMVWDNILGKQRAYSLFGSANAAMENSASQLDTCVISVPSTSKDNGQVFVAFLDNKLLNSGTYGPGLVLMRDGQKMKAQDTSKYKYSVEYIGGDKMKNQFQNIKIAGAYASSSKGDGTDNFHVYISYYDAYSHCLRYGKIELKPNLDKDNSTDLVAQHTFAADSSVANKFVVSLDSITFVG